MLLEPASLLLLRVVHVLRWQSLMLKLLLLEVIRLGDKRLHAHHVVGREAHLLRLLKIHRLIPMGRKERVVK